ncbi:MAG: LPXTG cell wall anchor domain-containing protein [Oscillospiraceae bacterium]|nr:LPXTG cell wall anchor domain-containing protein [Oscillospiraceae bacterium]
MKKLIAVLVALAMVLSMSVMAFAEFAGVKSPIEIAGSETDYSNAVSNPLLHMGIYNDIRNQGIYIRDDNSTMEWSEAWQAYYAYVVANAAADPATAISEIFDMVSNGYVEIGDAVSIAGSTLMGGLGGDGEDGDMSGIIDEILGTLGSFFGDEAEPEVSAEEYAQELAQMLNDGAGIDEITAKIGEDLANGKIVISQLPDIAAALSELVELGEIEDNETVQQILEFLEGLGGEGDGGFQFPDFGDFTLPWDNDNSSSGSFLDTILGILGTIGDLLFGGGGDDGNGGSGFEWGDGDGLGDIFGGGDGDTTTVIPNTGDVSFIAVAAVAAVAGAALILTRKKNDDAE